MADSARPAHIVECRGPQTRSGQSTRVFQLRSGRGGRYGGGGTLVTKIMFLRAACDARLRRMVSTRLRQIAAERGYAVAAEFFR